MLHFMDVLRTLSCWENWKEVGTRAEDTRLTLNTRRTINRRFEDSPLFGLLRNDSVLHEIEIILKQCLIKFFIQIS